MQIQVQVAKRKQKVNIKIFSKSFRIIWIFVLFLFTSDFKCSTCQKAYSSKSTLAAHEKTHQAVDQNKCKFCKIEFKQQSAYEKHMETEHPLYVQFLFSLRY